MAIYRHCTGCGRGFDQSIWQRESFCGSCGWPLKQLPMGEPQEIHPYPDHSHGPVGRRQELGNAVSEVRMFAGEHPFAFATGTVVAGIGALMLAPTLISLGSGVMVAGCIVASLGLLSVFSGGEKDAGNIITAGILILGAGAGLTLIGNIIAVAGVISILTGSAVAAKASVEYGMRKRIEHQLREKSLIELIGLSRQLEN